MQECWESGLKDTLLALTGFGSRLNPGKKRENLSFFLLTILVVL